MPYELLALLTSSQVPYELLALVLFLFSQKIFNLVSWFLPLHGMKTAARNR